MLFQPEADLMAPPAKLNKIELYTLCQLVGDLMTRPAGLLSPVVNIPVVICGKNLKIFKKRKRKEKRKKRLLGTDPYFQYKIKGKR